MTLTNIGCTFGPDKNMSHEHDTGCKMAEREIEWSKPFTGVASFWPKWNKTYFLPNLTYILGFANGTNDVGESALPVNSKMLRYNFPPLFYSI